MVKPEYIFPLLLILLDMGAAIVYAIQKDYKKAVYWLAAAVLNITVTFQEAIWIVQKNEKLSNV